MYNQHLKNQVSLIIRTLIVLSQYTLFHPWKSEQLSKGRRGWWGWWCYGLYLLADCHSETARVMPYPFKFCCVSTTLKLLCPNAIEKMCTISHFCCSSSIIKILIPMYRKYEIKINCPNAIQNVYYNGTDTSTYISLQKRPHLTQRAQ